MIAAVAIAVVLGVVLFESKMLQWRSDIQELKDDVRYLKAQLAEKGQA